MTAADRIDRQFAKLLVVNGAGAVSHLPRVALASLFQPGDLVVANDAATLPASLNGVHRSRAVSQRNKSRGIPESALIMLYGCRRVKEAAGMALSDDLRTRVVEAVVVGGLSRNAAAKRFGVSIASAIRWVWRFQATGEISPAPTGGDRRSDRIEAHGEYLLGLIRRQPDITLLEIQERLIANCGERFSFSVIWRFFDRHEITFKKKPRMPRSSSAPTS